MGYFDIVTATGVEFIRNAGGNLIMPVDTLLRHAEHEFNHGHFRNAQELNFASRLWRLKSTARDLTRAIDSSMIGTVGRINGVRAIPDIDLETSTWKEVKLQMGLKDRLYERIHTDLDTVNLKVIQLNRIKDRIKRIVLRIRDDEKSRKRGTKDRNEFLDQIDIIDFVASANAIFRSASFVVRQFHGAKMKYLNFVSKFKDRCKANYEIRTSQLECRMRRTIWEPKTSPPPKVNPEPTGEPKTKKQKCAS